jgi:hypothetical protein
MFRFTIRDVLWLMVVVAMAVGWFAHWSSWKANRPPEFVLREFRDLDAKVKRQEETIRKLLGVKEGDPVAEAATPFDP